MRHRIWVLQPRLLLFVRIFDGGEALSENNYQKIVLTGDDKVAVQAHAAAAGVDLVCTKPMDIMTIRRILTDVEGRCDAKKQKQREVLSKFAS